MNYKFTIKDLGNVNEIDEDKRLRERVGVLFQKQQKAELSPSEEKELGRLLREQRFSINIIKLFERAEGGDPNVIEVSMNDGKSCEVLPTDTEEKTIFTYGLGGCYATLVYTEHADGRRAAVLTHYSPTNISANIAELRRLIAQKPSMKESITRQVVTILGEGEYVQDTTTGKWELKITNSDSQHNVELLILAIKAELGDDIEVKQDIEVKAYDAKQIIGIKDRGVFVVRIPPTERPTYQTWFSSGELGKSFNDSL
jgi:hypothetical protein